MANLNPQSHAKLPMAAWPAEPVAFECPALSPIVLVPLSVHPAPHHLISVPPGTQIGPGGLLTDGVSEAAHAALSPAAGIVGPTRLVPLTNGQMVRAVEVRLHPTPSADPPHEEPPTPAEFAARMAELAAQIAASAAPLPAWIDRLRLAGIFADRPTSPDLLGQLHQLLTRPVDTVICNLLDMDPTIRLSATLAANSPREIAAGVHLISTLARAKQRLIVADDASPPPWLRPLRRFTGPLDIALVPVHNDYPQGDPSLLLYRLLRRRLRPRRLPTEQGVLIIDGATACAIGQNVLSAAPMLGVPIGIHDHLLGRTHLLRVPLGTPLRYVLREIGWSDTDIAVRSGALFGNARISPDAVIGGCELTIHLDTLHPLKSPDPCIRCGWCAEGCPTRVQPAGLLEAAQWNDMAMAQFYGIEACIECGICSYVCPSRLPLLESIRTLRTA